LLEAWKDVFGIEERHKAKLCGHNEGKAWLVQIIDEAANVLMIPTEMLAAKRKTATSDSTHLESVKQVVETYHRCNSVVGKPEAIQKRAYRKLQFQFRTCWQKSNLHGRIPYA
jgi:hypothetical protein